MPQRVGSGVFLNKRKFRLSVLLVLCLFLLPSLFLYTSWLTDFEWWNAGQWTWNKRQERNSDIDSESKEYSENLDTQLKNVRCPAKVGLELRDYWNCLWHTSITSDGIEQHKKIMRENYVNRVDEELQAIQKWNDEKLNRTMKRKVKRVRRQDSGSEEYFMTNEEAALLFKGVALSLDISGSYESMPEDVVRCLHKIIPGVSMESFLLCARRPIFKVKKQYEEMYPDLDFGVMGQSLTNPLFQTTTYPEINTSYNPREFPLLKMTDQRSSTTYMFRVAFTPLADEESQQYRNFFGADPYLDNNFSPYRYRYNNMNFKQRQPAWTYRGLHGSKDWHKLDLDRFILPTKKDADLKKTAFIGELTETYPVVGELADALQNIDAPLDYRWTKDSGYTAYTRYLLPLLQKNDLAYYKLKGLIDPNAQLVSTVDTVQNIINQLNLFKEESRDSILLAESSDDVPYRDVYLNFMAHFFHMDMQKYRTLKKRAYPHATTSPDVLDELEAMRLLIRAYVEVVITQLACLREMVKQSDHRVEFEEKLVELIENARQSESCITANSEELAIEESHLETDYDPEVQFVLGQARLRQLYELYYDRLDARQRYSLPKYPVEFPICKHNDPSPIDIKSRQGRKSSIRDYTFGEAAFRLNRFFMFFPLDSSPLLTVGIVEGERLDDSSVRLTGGAVRGQNLTFQYMHIRFGHKWNAIGSEHWIDGKGAAMELQMVFTISGSADPVKYWHILSRVHNQLFQFREKLVIILAVLVDVLESDEDVKRKIQKENLHQDPYLFEPLAQAAHHFRLMPQVNPKHEQPRGYVSKDPMFRFIDFIPRKSSNFYTYRGSLSWPPCFGYVIWSVYEQRLYMSKRQFDEFVRIPAYGIHSNNYAHDNFRKFEDIYVEEEHDPRLTYYQIEAMKKQRTVDRHILTGYHHVEEDGSADDDAKEDSVVGQAFYDIDFYAKSGSQRSQHIPREIKILIMIPALSVLLIHG